MYILIIEVKLNFLILYVEVLLKIYRTIIKFILREILFRQLI